jgi:hypothetical protein
MSHNPSILELSALTSRLANTLRRRSVELQAQDQEIQYITELLLDISTKLSPTHADNITSDSLTTQAIENDLKLDSQWPDALKHFYLWGCDARAADSPTFAIDPNADKSSVTESDE